MRVLHINVNYLSTALHQTMIEHFQNEVENVIFVPTYDKNRSVITPNPNVIVRECFRKWDRIAFIYKQSKIQRALENAVNLETIDCIHAYTVFTDGNTAYKLSKKYSIPYVVAVRDTDVNTFFKYAVHLRKRGVEIMKNASAVFFLSTSYRETVLEKYIPSSCRKEIMDKSYIIPNGIADFWLENAFSKDAQSSLKRILENRELRCIYVGAIEPRKNVELTLKALRHLNETGWNASLTAIGKVKNRNVFTSLNKYNEFRYISQKSSEELLGYFRQADVFIMPSHTETFGLVYAEAMSQGLPVIYTRGQGFDGQFPDGTVGYSVYDRDEYELAEKILLCVNNYEQLCEAPSKKVSKFNWNSICSCYYDIYKSIIS